MSDAPAIEALSLSIGYAPGKPVLENLSFSIARGEIFALLGGSGCGKSSLLRTLIGLLPPLAGSVRILSRPFAQAGVEPDEHPDLLPHIGVMFQNGALFGSKSLLENCAIPQLSLSSRSPAEIDAVSRDKLRQVGLLDFASFLPAEISGGMQKRAAIARALVLDPEILFLDEPSAGLDPVTSAELDDLILRIRDSLGTTIVFVSHELPSIFSIADRAAFLDRSSKSLLAIGSPAALRDSSPFPAVRDFFNRSPRKVPHA